jgi:hypothetical protein
VAVSRLSPKLLRQVVAVAKQKFKSASLGLSAMPVPAAVKPTPVTRFERQLQRLRDSICLVGAESTTANAVSSMAGLVKQEAFPMVHPVESVSPVCPSSDFPICAPSSGCMDMGAALEVSAALGG